MQSFVFVECVFKKGDLVREVGLFEHPLGVVAHHFVLLGVLRQQSFDLFGVGVVGLFEKVGLLSFLLVVGFGLLEIRREFGYGGSEFPIFVFE